MTNKRRKVEVFTAGCQTCEPAVQLVKDQACESCEVRQSTILLNQGCATNECRQKAKAYGIERLPAVVVDGKLLDCCRVGAITKEKLVAAGVGKA
ncbi:MAG: glutaredoxin [Deltaproteobacteria bacterium CG11_big_fil_rev_8_21_14_0_20_45_16]|nr:MAG: glutaredoxin [Deltaproteobacteria bacterium CG11_big_fil_rev_8_21_14_0_20_45_16]